MVQNRFEVLGEEDEQDFEMSPTVEVTTTERLFPSKRLPPTLPACSGAIRREDSIQFADCGWSAATTFLKTPPWCRLRIKGFVCRMMQWRTQLPMSSFHIPMRRAVQKQTPIPSFFAFSFYTFAFRCFLLHTIADVAVSWTSLAISRSVGGVGLHWSQPPQGLPRGRGRVTDTRRLEVVVDCLEFFSGAQLAVDTTLVSALHADGSSLGREQQWVEKP